MKQLRLLLLKDLHCLAQNQHALISSFGFALLLVVLASFSFREIGLSQEQLRSLTPGMLMLTFLFAGITAIREATAPEYNHRGILGVMLAPVDPWIVYLAKFLTNALFLGALFVFVTILHEIFFGVQLAAFFGPLLLVVGMFALGFAALGTMVSLLVLVTSSGEVLFPLVLFPLLIPLLIGTLELIRMVLGGEAFQLTNFWFTLVVLFDAVMFILSLVLFEYVVRD